MASLPSKLALFDGRHTDVLERVAVSLRKDPGACEKLVDIASRRPKEPVAVAAMWVLLRLCKDGAVGGLGADAIARLGVVLVEAEDWTPRLHVLQVLARHDVASILNHAQREVLRGAAARSAEDANAFVRAWSLHLLGRLGGSAPGTERKRIAHMIAAAERTGAASIKARLRQLRQAGGLDWMDDLSV